MRMTDREAIARQVLRNCDISDARNAGLYSICGLALRLRDLYKWETGTPPWEEKESSAVLEWIGRRETRWEALAEDDFLPISIAGREYDPFDTAGINAALVPAGLFYGAGYGRRLKPTFFLAAVETRYDVAGVPVAVLGREFARDLAAMPALSQDGVVLLRKETARLFLWDQMLYIGKSGRRALADALDACGISDHRPAGIRDRLDDILAANQDAFIYHEVGEIRDRVFDRTLWRQLIAEFPHSAVELLARSVKDLLADTAPEGPLVRMVATKNRAAIGFYTAFQNGVGLEIFPELRPAYASFSAGGNWQGITAAVTAGRERAGAYTDAIMAIFREGTRKNDLPWAAETIEKRLLAPLGHRDAA